METPTVTKILDAIPFTQTPETLVPVMQLSRLPEYLREHPIAGLTPIQQKALVPLSAWAALAVQERIGLGYGEVAKNIELKISSRFKEVMSGKSDRDVTITREQFKIATQQLLGLNLSKAQDAQKVEKWARWSDTYYAKLRLRQGARRQ